MTVNTSDPMIGRLVDGRYEVRSRIARGGMATVYLATDLRLERKVAIKVMHPHLADDRQFTQRFIQEARSAARLAHPNVVNVFDQGQDGESAYLVMEYLSGITLRELLQEYGSLTPEQTLDIAEAVLSGLAAAHRAGIVHRDLKPENVLLADDGRIKIGDFGLARAATANTATGAALLGTIAYLSPELVTRGVADARSDIYAVGIMIFEMLTGRQPYTGEQPMQIAYQHANDTVPAPSTLEPTVPEGLDDLVLWATARDPEERPADAAALLARVREVDRNLRESQGDTGAQPTAVLPAAMPISRAPAAPTAATTVQPAAPATGETEIIGRRGARPDADPAAAGPATATLARSSRTRRRRRVVILAIVVVLALIAAGVGWWFGAGPGAVSSVPDVSSTSPEDAAQILEDAGFVVDEAQGQAYSVDVAVGLVAETDPAIGEVVARGATVQLLISQGPQPFDLPTLAGQEEGAALTLVESHWTAEDPLRQFSSEVAPGIVIDALDADGTSLAGVAQYGEKQPITLIVSAGPLPDVSGNSVEEATAVLKDVELTASPGPEEFNGDVPKGAVIGVVTTDADGNPLTIRTGDEVALRISRGPEQVQIPDLVGDVWSEAKATLQAAGFQIAFKNGISEFLDGVPDSARVKSLDPEAGNIVDKGSTVTVALEAG
ncbi:MAG: Stk1 family PASTA domain-containing Ser/Thr kinase [Actinomycetales bacterium]|nr:Stk1 family PASTA domain-containing Ser/Thr kinase [Actinomycetales bacterium]